MRRPVVLALRRTYSSAAPTSAVHKLTPDDYARALSSPDAHLRTRNFCIVAHIDHGKSTLADRLLQATGREAQADQTQVLDTLQVEKERGITVKANTATMLYTPKGEKLPFVLNLIDTPGHVDFSFEVNRSVNACDGALLLVDSTQGIQAQTLANYRMVKKANLDVIPLLTKLDLQHSFPDGIKEQLFYVLDIDPDHVIETSAKANIGIQETLDRIVKDISPPKVDLDSMNKRLKCHLLDSWFDQHRGVICLIKVFQGQIKKNETVHFLFSEKTYSVQDIGIVTPEKISMDSLRAGQVGYLVCGIKSSQEITLGDTIYGGDKGFNPSEALQMFERRHSMVFASIFPSDSETFLELKAAVEKLLLNDPSVQAQIESSDALGMGYNCGFNGVLHMEVFCERLTSEFGVDVVITAPMVPYRIYFNKMAGQALKGTCIEIRSPNDFPDPFKIDRIEEPMVNCTIIAPPDYTGQIHEICRDHRGIHKNMQYLGEQQTLMLFLMPLSEVVTSFYNKIKSLTSGHATVDFEDAGFEAADLVKLDILLNGDKVDALSTICDRRRSVELGRKLTSKLKETIDRQLFEIVIQAAIGAKIVARDRVAPYRKDVLMKSGKLVGGGDVTRKMKLLNRQKEGKKRMKQIGNVSLSQEAFLSVLRM